MGDREGGHGYSFGGHPVLLPTELPSPTQGLGGAQVQKKPRRPTAAMFHFAVFFSLKWETARQRCKPGVGAAKTPCIASTRTPTSHPISLGTPYPEGAPILQCSPARSPLPTPSLQSSEGC